MIYLANKPADVDVVLDAMWTWCGNKVWPDNGTWDFAVQCAVNMNAPEKVTDILINNYKLLYSPKSATVNNFLACLY